MIEKQNIIKEIIEQRCFINNASLKYTFFKRLFDLAMSLFVIIFLSFIFIAIPIWIKIRTKGEVFYAEEKYGLLGNRFYIYEYAKIIKKTTIRRMPLLLNILIGNMSFVGPQPASTEDITYEPWHNLRLSAKPGITGLWQVSGRKGGVNEMARTDLKYIRERSIRGDIIILLKAICLMFKEKKPSAEDLKD